MSRASTTCVSSYDKKILTSFLVLNTLMCLDSFKDDTLDLKYLEVLNDYKNFCEDFTLNLEVLLEESKMSSNFIKECCIMSRVSKILHAFAFKRVESVCIPFMVLNLFVYIKDRLDESSNQTGCLTSRMRSFKMSSVDVYELLDTMYDVLSECVASKIIEASEHVCDSLCLEFEL